MHKHLILGLPIFPLLLGEICAKETASEAENDYALLVPEIDSDYVLIYKPQPDMYTRGDTKNYISGKNYNKWQPNDHTFTQGPNGRWHLLVEFAC